MAAADDLVELYADLLAAGDAELVQVGATPDVIAMFREATEVLLGDQLATAPTLRLMATVAAIEGAVCIRRGASFRIRQVQKLPPQGGELLLILQRL